MNARIRAIAAHDEYATFAIYCREWDSADAPTYDYDGGLMTLHNRPILGNFAMSLRSAIHHRRPIAYVEVRSERVVVLSLTSADVAAFLAEVGTSV